MTFSTFLFIPFLIPWIFPCGIILLLASIQYLVDIELLFYAPVKDVLRNRKLYFPVFVLTDGIGDEVNIVGRLILQILLNFLFLPMQIVWLVALGIFNLLFWAIDGFFKLFRK